jgi:hypothetical protein
MLIKSLMVIVISSTFFLTGCYSLNIDNPTKKYDYILDEVLGEWEVVDKDTKTENTNHTVPIIPLFETSTTWKIQYFDNRNVKRILEVNNGNNLAYELLSNMDDIIKSEIDAISPHFTEYVYMMEPYFWDSDFSKHSIHDIYSKYHKVLNVKDFKINNYFKGKPVYIETKHYCDRENEAAMVQCKKEIDESMKKIPYINTILFSDDFHYYIQGEEVSREILESQAGENDREKYHNLLKERFPQYRIQKENTK